MSQPLSRRQFLERAALTAVALPLWSRSGTPDPFAREQGSAGAPALAAQPFDLHRVRLLPGPQLTALEVNRAYMLGLDPDRLLHVFRVNAGFASPAKPYGGWEAPVNELRGHFAGHYLSACALMGAQTGDPTIKARGIEMVAALAPVQEALGGGYLSAFPKEYFERLRRRERVWAPFYTYHKILAGLIDTYTLSGDAGALAMAIGMADWVRGYVAPIPAAQWTKMLTTEYGGMNDVLRELAQVTGNDAYASVAARFDQATFFTPLAEERDALKGVHANTNVPKVLGAARWYEMTGDERPHRIATFFWEDVTGRRSYATGGTSSGEEWVGDPGQLAESLGGYTQETCVTYNMLKLTRRLFTWSPEARFADYYERAYFNGILPTQHPRDGEKMYYTPLADGYWKLFGTPEFGFWCCQGTGVENFSKLGDSIYFHDERGIFVNLFVPSEVEWVERGVRLRQETKFPASDRIALVVTVAAPTALALRVRIPYWAARGVTARLNGRVIPVRATPSSYLVVDRTWNSGDRLELKIPMSLHAHPMPDDPSLQAVMYGPLVLVAKMGTAGLTDENRRAVPTAPRTVPEYQEVGEFPAAPMRAPSADPASWLKPVPGQKLTFRTVGQGEPMTFVPLLTLFDERYAAYLRIIRS